MSMLLIAGYWGVALWGLNSRQRVLLYLFFAVLPLGTFTVVPPAMLGGVSLIAASMTALLIVVREIVLSKDCSRILARQLFQDSRTTYLSAFWLVSALTTIFVPRIRAGDITVISLSGLKYGPAALAPSMQNFTQLGYLTVSVLAVFAFAQIFRSGASASVLLTGLVIADSVTLITGVLDFLSSYLPTAAILTPFRTANYSIIESASLGDGTRRVIGLMPEASSFGYISMALFSMTYFIRSAAPDEKTRRQLGQLSIGLGIMAVLSTSSAGYAAILVTLALMSLHWVARTSRGTRSMARRRGTQRDLFIALGVVSVILLVAMLHPDTLRPVGQRFEELLLAKRNSESYVERSMWTSVSLRAGVASGFVGVGLGSTRASNYAVVLFATTGVAGVVLFAVFAGRLLLRPVHGLDQQRREMASAMRWSFLPLLVIGLLIGATADFGVLDAVRWGALVAWLQGTVPPPSGRPVGGGRLRVGRWPVRLAPDPTPSASDGRSAPGGFERAPAEMEA